MRKEQPIVSCTFGWGKVFHLYRDSLDINGKRYALTELEHIRPIYRRVIGISSARLELVFGKKKVVLRGIAALEDLWKVVEYLSAQCAHSAPRERDSEQRAEITESQHRQEVLPESESDLQVSSLFAHSDLCQSKLAGVTPSPVEIPGWLRMLQEQHERRRRRIRVEHSLHEYGFDVETLAQHLQYDALPSVQVPVRLLPGEEAYYRTDATLCGERIGDSSHSVYPALDYGLVILTNVRLIYLGRKSQIVLDYVRLLHISRLNEALAFETNHWRKRVIFELSRPLECIMYLERILRDFPQNEHSLAEEPLYLDSAQAEEQPQAYYRGRGEVDTAPLPMCNWHTMDTLITLEALERENIANLGAYGDEM